MPIDLSEFAQPTTTALLVIETQQGVIGEYTPAPLGALRDAAASRGLVPRLAKLVKAARKAGVHVFHCPAGARPDGLGSMMNTRLAQALKKSGRRGMVVGSPESANLPGLEPQEGDFVIWRTHGMTAFHDTSLDSICRNMGIRTIIPTGVSINVAITGATIEAVNRAYRVVIPTDCVVGFPPEYGDMVLKNALVGLAFLTTAQELAAAWDVDWSKL
ncbi:MAG TPA: cysteine hydrolase [Candidatus Binataceae bacterium]|nr:cysteine hydrolase [Candidatus Binataceae bacterium]